MQWNGRGKNSGTARSLSNRMTALALAVGIAFAAGQGEAWAATGDADSGAGATVHSAPAPAASSPAADPKDPKDSKDAKDDVATHSADEVGTPPSTKGTDAPGQDDREDADAGAVEAAARTDDEATGAAPPVEAEQGELDSTPEKTPEPAESPGVDVVDTGAPETTDSAPAVPKTTEPVVAEVDPISVQTAGAERSASPTTVSAVIAAADKQDDAAAQPPRTGALEPSVSEPAAAKTTTAVAALATVTGPVVTTGPKAPEPLSPIAELLQLPGRIVNAVLQLFGFTVGDGTKTPFTLAPINDLLFAVFRGFERLLGLDKTPAVQQVVPTLTYTGPTTGTTPTVAQFLNAAAAEYILGGVPADLVPFTVNGFQMASTNIFSGMSARAWVTADQQIVIAYQGTTGGTNLLFNPLIAISQLLTDMQVIFTNTTPWAFYDALRFARQVEAEATKQGYGTGAIFVTGHSLGGWEAEYVAQQTGWGGIGFESPGINTTVAGNGAHSNFVNIETYGDLAAYMSTDLPGLQPFMSPYVPGGGSKPHYGAIVMIGDPNAVTPLVNAAKLWGKTIIGSIIFMIDFLGNFLQHHLPGMQAYNLGVTPDPGVVTWLGTATGPVDTWGNLTISQLKLAASTVGRLINP